MVIRDPSGNLLQKINEGDGQAFTKSAYNAVNWITSTYRGYNTSGTSYSQAITVSTDIIVEQTDKTYDEAGNVVSAASSQRWNGDSTTTGGLTSSFARVSYTAMWFDGIDRIIASANYGAVTSFTRLDTPPSSSSTILVTLTSYNDGGEASQVTDPMGNVTRTTFDNAGRTTQVVEAYGTSSARTTTYTYTLDNLIATMTAVNATTGDQITTWTYGTSSSSSVFRNDLLASVTYPDSTTGSPDLVSYAYNRQGQQEAVKVTSTNGIALSRKCLVS